MPTAAKLVAGADNMTEEIGALTVLTHVHIAWATAHQALGFLLVSLLIVAGHRFRVRPDALVAKP